MTALCVLREFSNVGFISPRRAFHGFSDRTKPKAYVLAPRVAVKIQMKPGDLLSVDLISDDQTLMIWAFDQRGETALNSLNLAVTMHLDTQNFDSEEFLSWLRSLGGQDDSNIRCHALSNQSEPVFLKSNADIIVWLASPVSPVDLVDGKASNSVHISHQPSCSSSPMLPNLLGDTRDEFTVKRGSAEAYEVKKGEYIQIIDVQGQQCSDFMAFRAKGLDQNKEWMIDSTATRTMVRGAYPRPGLYDKFFDQDLQPLLNVVQDTCGRHDTFGLACTARGYEERGFPGHLNCSDNMSLALDPFGVQRRSAWPAINFFWNTWIDHNRQQLMTAESYSRPGDYVVMRAMEDLVCVSTACPDDIDPINGWNPTDIHVRIYRPDTPIRRAVAYREKEDAPMSISQESAFHERLAPLTEHFAPARDLWAPVNFPATGALGEYWACRNAVTLQDMSGLRKYDIIGPDAEALLQHALTRNVAKLAVWRGTYTLMCDDSGHVIDDGTLFRLDDHLFRWCCGSEESGRTLTALADEMNLQVRINEMRNSLPNLAIQGPRSRDLLKKICFFQPNVPNLDHMNWFGVSVARMNDRNGAPFMISRSGYTGELGYEVFCAKSHAVEVWDAIMTAGQEFGIKPMGSEALEIIRIEAGLAAANAEFASGIDAFEAGLGFAVDLRKESFRGKDALERNASNPRCVLKGLLFDCDDVPHHGAPLYVGERQVGQITSATRSPSLECAIAMARVLVEHAKNGTVLEVGLLDGRMKRLNATVTDIPFIDPQRKRARA
ncbi:aminomethyltransferase [Epibacterium ulvae]|uniref:Aminomethyltransferase n=2 Tax=Epibacterium ulvae TaxID=1156985 RepID=A0A1G5PPC0_9RHOB|nr:aminomethyltransferase [Epibacterium ulvae]